MTLDAGQKRIGPHTCTDCSCYYSPGAFEDEEVHRKLHLQHQNLHSIRVLFLIFIVENVSWREAVLFC